MNGALGKVLGFQYCSQKVDVVDIEFNGESVGRNLMDSDDISRWNNWVPIKRNKVSSDVKRDTYHLCVKRT